MEACTIDDLAMIVNEVIGLNGLTLNRNMTASDVPGWDSLNHTLISLKIEQVYGKGLSAKVLAKTNNLGELIDLINGRLD